MIAWSRKVLAAPVFEDEERTRAARLLHVTLLVFLSFTGIVTLLILIFFGIPRDLAEAYTRMAGIGITAFSVFLFFLARRGRTRLAAVLLVLLVWGVITAWSLMFSGISGENLFLIYPFLIALSGLLLGEGAATAITWMSVLAIVGTYWAEVRRLVVPAPQTASPMDLLTTLPILLLTGLLLRYAVMSNAIGFKQARQREQELRESNCRLAEAQESLAERSAHLLATVQAYVACMAEVARGNLAARVQLEGQQEDDPLFVLGQRLNETLASLQQMTARLRDVADNLGVAAADILAATTEQASGAGQQAAAISEASATISEVQTIAGRTDEQSRVVAGVARRAAETAQVGQQAVAEAIQGMEQVQTRVETIANTTQALSERTQTIGVIIGTVSQIAAQSNLLALNAAVEAARAGEAGRGFAVVAGEVRARAEQSRAATAQVKELLSEIQSGVDTAVLATEEGIKGSEAGLRLIGQAGQVIRQLAESVIESDRAADRISAAAGQQLLGMEQIALAVSNIEEVTSRSLANTQQAERAAVTLNELARTLREAVAQYRL